MGDPFPAAPFKVPGSGTYTNNFPGWISAAGRGGARRANGLLQPSPSSLHLSRRGAGRVGLGSLLKKSHRFVELGSAPPAACAGAGTAARGRGESLLGNEGAGAGVRE